MPPLLGIACTHASPSCLQLLCSCAAARMCRLFLGLLARLSACTPLATPLCICLLLLRPVSAHYSYTARLCQLGFPQPVYHQGEAHEDSRTKHGLCARCAGAPAAQEFLLSTFLQLTFGLIDVSGQPQLIAPTRQPGLALTPRRRHCVLVCGCVCARRPDAPAECNLQHKPGGLTRALSCHHLQPRVSLSPLAWGAG